MHSFRTPSGPEQTKHPRTKVFCHWEQCRRNFHGNSAGGTYVGTFQEFMGTVQKEHYGISAAGTFIGTVQEDFHGKCEEELHGNRAKDFYGKGEEELYENRTLGIFMGTEQEEHS